MHFYAIYADINIHLNYDYGMMVSKVFFGS
jgi:hypothetical protein